jgi:hypothetical protein
VIPNHILNDLTFDDRVAILSRGGEIHLLVHRAASDPAVIRADAAWDGFRVLTTHLRDGVEIQEFVKARGPDIGGEG